MLRVVVIIDRVEGVELAVRCRRPYKTLTAPFIFKSAHHDKEFNVVNQAIIIRIDRLETQFNIVDDLFFEF